MEEEKGSEQLQQIVNSNEEIKVPEIESRQIFNSVEYAGFWARFAASFLDSLIIFTPTTIIAQLIMGRSFASNILVYAIGWTYMIYMLNASQATLGKMAVGLKVTAVDGGKVPIGKLALREIIGKSILNTLTLGIGYLMVVFTEKKQGLHDMISDTVVVYDPARKRRTWLVVVGIILALVIPIAGILSAVILVSTNSARNKAQDASVKATISTVVSGALIYNDDKGTFKGFELERNFKIIECSGEPILRISPDGKNIAIFAKSCSNDKKYFCADEDGLIEMSSEYANSGNASCINLN